MTEADSGYRLVLTTTDSEESAERLARALVEKRLAACVNIVAPVTSVYRYNGEIVTDQERLLLIKTRAVRFRELSETIRSLHGYDVPEIVSLEIAEGDETYLKWLTDCVAEAK